MGTGAISLIDYHVQTPDAKKSALVQKITNVSVFMRILRFVTVPGTTYTYGEQTKLGGVAFRGINGTYTADTGVVNPKVEHLSIFGGEVKTDQVLVQLDGGKVSRANAIMAKTRRAGLFFDKYVIDGNPSGGNANRHEFIGLNARLVGNQVITAGANGAALTLAMIDDLIDRTLGPNEKKVLVMCKADRRKLKQLCLAAAGGAGVTDMGGSLKSYDGVPIEVIDEDGDETPILAKDETQGSSNVTSSIYCIVPGEDPEGENMQGLIGSKMIEQRGPYNYPTHVSDVVEALAGIALFHGRAAARLKGVL